MSWATATSASAHSSTRGSTSSGATGPWPAWSTTGSTAATRSRGGRDGPCSTTCWARDGAPPPLPGEGRAQAYATARGIGHGMQRERLLPRDGLAVHPHHRPRGHVTDRGPRDHVREVVLAQADPGEADRAGREVRGDADLPSVV